MRKFHSVIALLTLLACSTAVMSAARRARNPAGIAGVVTEVNTGYFLMKLDMGMDSKVYVTGDTLFQSNGAKSDSTVMKAGVHIKLTGTSDDGGKHIEATIVNVVGGGKRSKSKSE